MTTLDPIVTIKHGTVRGKCDHTSKGYQFFSFQGIPYAKPPIGNLRFKAPQILDPWEGTKDATQEGNPCYIKDEAGRIQGSEDCLILNVYTPIIPNKNLPNETSKLNPVMVWIHGGAFISGSSSRNVFGPEFLIDKDIVLVTINYRLGALGFLSLNDCSLGVSGNAGLKDQVMALKWVQENIKTFGGDPDNVTLFGVSAGASSIGFHLVSPMSNGLFHKAIMQSGSSFCPWAKGSKNAAYQLTKQLGHCPKDDVEVLHILQSASKKEIVDAQNQLREQWKPTIQSLFCPTVENPNSKEEIFLPDEPMHLFKSGNFYQVPLIIGYNTWEGWFLLALEKITKGNFSLTCDEDYVLFSFGIEKNSKKSMEIGKKIREFYYGQETPSDENIYKWVDYISDTGFKRPALDLAENIMNTSSKKVFLYKFDLKTELNPFSILSGGRKDYVDHAEDLLYLFKTEKSPAFDDDSHENVGIQRLTKWWTNFAKYSDPNGLHDDPIFASKKWPFTNSSEMQYMNIDIELSVKNNLDKKMNDFWKSIEFQF